ncbi:MULTISPECIES: DUF4056 domain-containing protein [Aliivibrio]|uniref:DUF4056 domain-containing protein n=1 Tax=Aliivibrio logei TaxID=688 RepID=A0A1B9NWF1_ALILO|nr:MULTISPECIES: DUF4056 domain-containing protein [Aliivibrio]MBB1314480.1 DUF4056 domain-containing protein [Aliivibrio sp. SR45-2]OCH19549.1 hypothetical protein A6E04_16110 [Aliivibrio logei]
MNSKTVAMIASFLFLGSSFSVFAEAPVGVRPCCAFGTNLQTEVGGIPVPFVSVENVLNISELGDHIYNDGSQSVASSLMGFGDESNGIFYSEKGGFLDSAHIRDTADFTYFLYTEISAHLGENYSIALSPELKDRIVQMNASTESYSQAQRKSISIEVAALTAYRLAQWHEIAQWFGMESVGGFKEYASAFSPEDLYSNMLGAKLASAVISNNPNLDKNDFSKAMTQAIHDKFIELKVGSKEESKAEIESMDGVWWDSDKRLPNKWVVIHREYHLGTDLRPNGFKNGMEESLATEHEGLVTFKLMPNQNDNAFVALPKSLQSKSYWTPSDFQRIADFAKEKDDKELSTNP